MGFSYKCVLLFSHIFYHQILLRESLTVHVTFEFSIVPSSRIPLMVEVWHRDANRKDALLGICEVNLSTVFGSEKAHLEVRSAHSEIFISLPKMKAFSPIRMDLVQFVRRIQQAC